MLVVHHLGVSASERIVWLCEELGLDYELERYDRAATRMAPEAYKALHPIGTAPVIEDGDVLLAESNAIVAYILGRYGQGRLEVTPADPAFPHYVFWTHFANGSLQPVEAASIRRPGAPAADDPVALFRQARADAYLGMAEARVAEATWFAGDMFTAADIMMVFPLTTMRRFTQRDLTPFPAIRAYLARVGARPAYQRAMAKGDPDMAPLLD